MKTSSTSRPRCRGLFILNLGIAALWAMGRKLKFNIHMLPVLSLACLLLFSGCASVEGTAEIPPVSTNLLTRIERIREKKSRTRLFTQDNRIIWERMIGDCDRIHKLRLH